MNNMVFPSAKWLPNLLEQMLDGVSYCQMLYEDGAPSDYRYLYTNPAFHQQTGMGAVSGRLVSEVIPGFRQSGQHLLEIYGRVARTGVPESFEYHFDALQQWYFVQVFCPEYERFVTIFNVVTKAKEAEAALKQSEERLRNLIDQNHAMILQVDSRSGRVLDANAAALRFYGWSREQIRALSIHDIRAINPLRVIEEKGQALRQGRNHYAIEHRLANGDIRTVEVHSTPIATEDGYVLVKIIHDITARRAAEQRTEYLATHDRLTDLPNRTLFFDRLSQALSRARRKNECAAVLVLDLDDFKPVNDQYGHEAGDEVLQVISSRMLACIREMDTLARLGGDEFAIVLGETGNAGNLDAVAQKLIAALSEPVELGSGSRVRIGVSIGIAIYPQHGNAIDTLMNAADRAMYDSKSRGKNTYSYSAPETRPPAPGTHWPAPGNAHLLGDPLLDEQHQLIGALLGKLNTAIVSADAPQLVLRRFDDLAEFVRTHFESEERLMEQLQYPDYDAHREVHRSLLAEAQQLRPQLNQDGESAVLQALEDWAALHILRFDRRFAEFLASRETELRSGC
jgi:diguanylate cyclase (GGDEF)-like protein/hemerythrin-like metal-binding protein/PAS domain S-box-containing protein